MRKHIEDALLEVFESLGKGNPTELTVTKNQKGIQLKDSSLGTLHISYTEVEALAKEIKDFTPAYSEEEVLSRAIQAVIAEIISWESGTRPIALTQLVEGPKDTE